MTKKAQKTHVGAQLDIEEYNLIRTWADKNGMSLSDFVRKALLDAVPQVEKARHDQAATVSTVQDKAFEELDKADEVNTGASGVLPVAPVRKPQPGVVTEAQRTHPLQRVVKVNTTPMPRSTVGPHPCVHLSQTVPANMRGQCQGTCANAQQVGKVCFWTPTTARSCPLFEAATVKDRNLISR